MIHIDKGGKKKIVTVVFPENVHIHFNPLPDSYEDSYMDGDRSSYDDDDSYADDPWDGYPRGDNSPGYSNGVNLTLNEEPEAKPTVMTLFDLAARVTAKHVSCEDMEQHQPPLDEELLKRVINYTSKIHIMVGGIFCPKTGLLP